MVRARAHRSAACAVLARLEKEQGRTAALALARRSCTPSSCLPLRRALMISCWLSHMTRFSSSMISFLRPLRACAQLVVASVACRCGRNGVVFSVTAHRCYGAGRCRMGREQPAFLGSGKVCDVVSVVARMRSAVVLQSSDRAWPNGPGEVHARSLASAVVAVDSAAVWVQEERTTQTAGPVLEFDRDTCKKTQSVL